MLSDERADIGRAARRWLESCGQHYGEATVAHVVTALDSLGMLRAGADAEAIGLLRGLTEAFRRTLSTGGEPTRCLACLSVRNIYDERGRRRFHHEPDCDYEAAEAFLAGLTSPGCSPSPASGPDA